MNNETHHCLFSLKTFKIDFISLRISVWLFFGLAEKEGFEPSVFFKDTTFFENAPFNHSGTFPNHLNIITNIPTLRNFVKADICD